MKLGPIRTAALSISIATGLYALSFGALSVAAGLTVGQTVALSALMFTGGSQFAFVGVLGAGGGLATATTAASLLGIRNAIYGVAMNAMLSPKGWRRFLYAHISIDEAVATAQLSNDRQERNLGFCWAGIGVWAFWNAFTLVGAIAGDFLGDPKVWGLDGAAVAAFIGLLWPRLKEREPIAMAVLGAIVTLATMPFVPAGIPIMIVAAVTASVSFAAHKRAEP